jgi:hypothetical protein
MTNRVRIDAPAGVIEIEGEKDFVEGLLAKFFPLIEEAGFGSQPLQSNNANAGENDSSETEKGGEEEIGKTKIKRRRGATPPKGQSCSDRVLVLKADGFFKTHRSGADIVAGLAAKGWTHKANQVSASTGQLFDKGELQRTKDGDGPWKYFWDRS